MTQMLLVLCLLSVLVLFSGILYHDCRKSVRFSAKLSHYLVLFYSNKALG